MNKMSKSNKGNDVQRDARQAFMLAYRRQRVAMSFPLYPATRDWSTFDHKAYGSVWEGRVLNAGDCYHWHNFNRHYQYLEGRARYFENRAIRELEQGRS